MRVMRRNWNRMIDWGDGFGGSWVWGVDGLRAVEW